MSPVKGFSSPRRGGVITLLVLFLSVLLLCGYNVSASSLAHHSNNNGGCEAIHRILNGTSNTNHHLHDKNEGFLVDHDQWHNHKDCK